MWAWGFLGESTSEASVKESEASVKESERVSMNARGCKRVIESECECE